MMEDIGFTDSNVLACVESTYPRIPEHYWTMYIGRAWKSKWALKRQYFPGNSYPRDMIDRLVYVITHEEIHLVLANSLGSRAASARWDRIDGCGYLGLASDPLEYLVNESNYCHVQDRSTINCQSTDRLDSQSTLDDFESE